VVAECKELHLKKSMRLNQIKMKKKGLKEVMQNSKECEMLYEAGRVAELQL